jgi:hypothetical protein
MAGTKRKHGEESSEAVYTSKSRSRPSVEGRIDPTYGQRSAIPGLDDDTVMEGDDEDLNYDEGMDALAYLRSVRLVHISMRGARKNLAEISTQTNADVTLLGTRHLGSRTF